MQVVLPFCLWHMYNKILKHQINNSSRIYYVFLNTYKYIYLTYLCSSHANKLRIAKSSMSYTNYLKTSQQRLLLFPYGKAPTLKL
jgi:hypothetical protein